MGWISSDSQLEHSLYRVFFSRKAPYLDDRAFDASDALPPQYPLSHPPNSSNFAKPVLRPPADNLHLRAMAGFQRFRFLAIATIFHVIYIYSIFDIYFVSPVVSGMRLFQVERPVEVKAPADRLVLFVGT